MLLRSFALAGAALLGNVAAARGVSPYLPLQMSPEIERQIERLLILADRPVIQRPIAAARHSIAIAIKAPRIAAAA